MPTKNFSVAVAVLFLFVVQVHSSYAKPLNVLVTLKPIHGLVSAVMQGVAQPVLLLGARTSPHHFNLRPSHAIKLEQANIVFWLGASLEPDLAKTVTTIAAGAQLLDLSEQAKLGLLAIRHWTKDAPSPSSEQTSDPHPWLDPNNAMLLVQAIQQHLSQAAPNHAEKFQENAQKTIARIKALTQTLAAQLSSLPHTPFLVAHDAFQYFERTFKLSNNRGALVLGAIPQLSASRLQSLLQAIQKDKISCLLSEPHFNRRLIRPILQSSSIKNLLADPLGINIPPGPNAWFSMMQDLADSFSACFSLSSL